MSKHTPGKWFAHRPNGFGTFYVEARLRPGVVQEIAACSPTEADGGYGEQQEANARLIAAAPDLLESLESALEELRAMKGEIGFRANTLDVIRQCETTIAKARGEA